MLCQSPANSYLTNSVDGLRCLNLFPECATGDSDYTGVHIGTIQPAKLAAADARLRQNPKHRLERLVRFPYNCPNLLHGQCSGFGQRLPGHAKELERIVLDVAPRPR